MLVGLLRADSSFSRIFVVTIRHIAGVLHGRHVLHSKAYVGMDKLTPISAIVLTAAKVIVHSHNLATEHSCLASTGILSLKPGSINTVPGIVHLSLDIRAGKDELLMGLEDRMRSDFERIADGEDVAHLNDGGTRGKGCSVEWQLDAPSAAVRFDEGCIRCVEESAAVLFGTQSRAVAQSMISGAGMYQASYADAMFPAKNITLTKFQDMIVFLPVGGLQQA